MVANPSTATAPLLPDPRRVDVAPIRPLLDHIRAVYHPEQVWLFGSRARGDATPSSDWDLLVVVPDDTDERLLDPREVWRMKRGQRVPSDVFVCRRSEFYEDRDTVNTLAHAVALEGVLVEPTSSRRGSAR